MARSYIGEMRVVQPQGPYCLCGFSSGGMVAFEMAQQLHAGGQRVDVLAILDSPARDGGQRSAWILEYLLGLTGKAWSRIGCRALQVGRTGRQGGVSWHLSQIPALFRAQVQATAKTLYYAARQGGRRPHPGWDSIRKGHEAELGEYGAGWPEYRWRVVEAQYQALWGYTPRPYAGRLILFRAHEQPASASLDPAMGWSSLAQAGVTVRRVPGTHLALLQHPSVKVLAAQLAPYLARI
jgi:thioesterase domain-containing protein